jgi:hypothetical protein
LPVARCPVRGRVRVPPPPRQVDGFDRQRPLRAVRSVSPRATHRDVVLAA